MRLLALLVLACYSFAQTVITSGGTTRVSAQSCHSGSVAYRSSSALAYGSRTNATLTAPVGIQDGDLVLIVFVIAATGTPPTPTAPAGFTAAPGFPNSVSDGNNFTVKTYCWYKLASSESGNYTITHASASSEGYIGAYSGANASAPITPNPTINTGAGTVSTATGLTTSADGTTVIFVSQDWGDLSAALSIPSGGSSFLVARLNPNTTSGLLYIADGPLASAGATGNLSTTNNNAAAQPWSAYLIAIHP